MRTYKTFYPILFLIILSACEVRMAPTEYWSKLFRTQTDSSYYQGKSESLANKIAWLLSGFLRITKKGLPSGYPFLFLERSSIFFEPI